MTNNRIIVLGGRGQFGRTAADLLREFGLRVEIAARRGTAGLNVDANDPESIRATLREGDLIVDTAGPFHARSSALLEAAIEIGFDVIDINDDLRYAETVLALQQQIKQSGIRVLSSASSVSAVAAAIIRRSGFASPTRVTSFLAPASRHTANVGAARSLIRSVGKPIRVFRHGELEAAQGWGESRKFSMPRPLGRIHGGLFESADTAYLPRIWPSLRDVSMYVDTNTTGANTLICIAARQPSVRNLLDRTARLVTAVARILGSRAGGIAYEIEDSADSIARYAIVAEHNSYVAAVAPAVLAARSIAENRFTDRGLVLPDRHVAPSDLFAYLESLGITVVEMK